METNHLIFLAGLLTTVPIGAWLASSRPWLRDACAFLLIAGTTHTGLQDINFVSREWYRGTTRGFEMCWLDMLWMILLVSVPRRPGRRAEIPASLPLMLVFFAFNALNVASSTPQLFGLFELSKMLRAILLFVAIAHYIKGDRELRVVVWALGVAAIYEFLATVHSRVILMQPRARGTLDHPNTLSMYNLMIVPPLLAVALSDEDRRLRRVCAAGALLGSLSVMFTISRNGIVTLTGLLLSVGALCGSFRITARKVAGAAVVLAVIGAAVYKTSGDFEKRFTESGPEYGGKVYEGRGAYLYLAELIVAHEPGGCGLNNWSWCVSNRYGPMLQQYHIPYVDTDRRPPKKKLRRDAHVDAPQAAPAHSLYAITLGETGWVGVVIFALLWLRWYHMTGSFLFRRDRSLRSRFGVGAFFGLLGAFSQSFTEWAYRQTPLLFMLYILLGAAAALYPVRPSAMRARAA
ncbi:O-antigen ligase family protein [Sorangium sp. So ce131]|uniref:O-antigen ligase family protein n=1 Tax=Sorangium sp. So ce131 TaxID=3133282 RepID=UPI003F5E4619